MPRCCQNRLSRVRSRATARRSSATRTALGARDAAVLGVAGPGLGTPPGRRPPAAAAGGLDEEDVARPDRNADLLRLEHARASAGEETVAMWQAVLAAEDAVRGVAHAVAGRVGDAGLRDIHAQAQHGADAAAMLPVAARVRSDLVLLERQREAHLGHLDGAELDAAHRLPLAGRLPAAADRAGAATTAGVEHAPDERPLRPRIPALDGDAKAPRPAGEHAIGTGAGEGLDHGLRDLLRAVIGGQRHRRWRPRMDDGALARDDLHRPEG